MRTDWSEQTVLIDIRCQRTLATHPVDVYTHQRRWGGGDGRGGRDGERGEGEGEVQSHCQFFIEKRIVLGCPNMKDIQ